MNNALYIQQRRRLFVKFVVGCILLSYPLAVAYLKPYLLLSPVQFLKATMLLYAELWFSYPYTDMACLAGHVLFVLCCMWWLRCGELRTWFFTLLTGGFISAFGGVFVYLQNRL